MGGPGTLRAGDLVAVSLPQGPAWLDVLDAAWQAGAAVLPLDGRLPGATLRELAERARPTVSLTADGARRLAGGRPVAPGVRLVMPTSGTAGSPKLVELTADAIGFALTASSARLGAAADDGWYGCLPVAHMGGMLVALRRIVLGTPVTLAPGFDPASFDRAVAAGARYSSLVPTALGRLEGVPLSGLRAVLVGGASLDPGLRSRFVEASGVAVVHTYGLTETCGGVVYDGRPLEGVEVRTEPDGGEIMVRTPSRMLEYRFDPAATKLAVDQGGWLRTRDAGEVVGGRLVVHGRVDDVIVTGGEKVWPEAVEKALRGHLSVGEVVVAGRPDAEWGQRVVAFVVPADPAAPPALEDLRAHASATLPRFALPKELIVTDALPQTASGKPLRRSAEV